VRAAANRGKRFPSLPILASVLFIVVVMGSQSYGGYTGQFQSYSNALQSLPNVATAWVKMQTPPIGDGPDYFLAFDRIAAIFPIPGSENTEVTVIFTSLQGVPFKMTYYGYFHSFYGDLHSGARVYAYFAFYQGSDGPSSWRLGYVININTLH
jgi:hypothetical protein